MTKKQEEEQNAVDHITDSMFSVAFLESITNFIFSKKRNGLTVGQFYDEWLREIGLAQNKVPFSLGIILGEVYVALLWGKENWYKILPEDEIKDGGEQWGLDTKQISFSKNSNPSIKDTITRMRNALAHARVEIIIPKGIKRENQFSEAKMKFCDVNKRQKNDIFSAVLTFEQVFKLIKKFQSTIHGHVRDKYNKTI